MALRMARPWKHPRTGIYWVRQRVPADLTTKAEGRLISYVGSDWSVQLRARKGMLHTTLGTKDDAIARARYATVSAVIEQTWAALRSGPITLNLKQRQAILGEWRAKFIAEFEDDPGDIVGWEEFVDQARPDTELAETNPSAAVAHIRAYIEGSVCPLSTLLSSKGLILTEESLSVLYTDAFVALSEVGDRLARNAAGDFSPDEGAKRYPPPIASASQKATPTFTFDDLFTKWEIGAASRPANTVRKFRAILLNAFAPWVAETKGHSDPARVTKHDAVAFKDHLLNDTELSLKSINDGHLAALKSVYAYAVENHHLPDNPFVGVKARGKNDIQRIGLDYSDAEAAIILRAARDADVKGRSTHIAAAIRWVPWLVCYSGARASEVAQLRKKDFQLTPEGWTFTITPDAGTVKTGKVRVVPVHKALVDAGLLRFIEEAPHGPLFHRSKGDQKEAVKGAAAAADKVREFLAPYVPERGDGKKVSPLHAFRHRFATVCREVGVPEQAMNAITGWASKGRGAAYGQPAGLRRAMDMIPTIVLDEEPVRTKSD